MAFFKEKAFYEYSNGKLQKQLSKSIDVKIAELNAAEVLCSLLATGRTWPRVGAGGAGRAAARQSWLSVDCCVGRGGD